MERLPMCRICLTENIRPCIVANRNLHKVYEKLTDIPFITEDSRPNLACAFCCAKLKQCYRLLRQCWKTEKLFVQRMNDISEPNSLINENRLEVFGGFIKSPVEQINIVGHIAVKEELSAVSEGPDDVIEPKEEYQSDEIEPENLDNSCPDVAGIPPHCYESDLEDDVPLINCKIEVEDEEMSKNNRNTEAINLQLENVDNSCLDVLDIPPHCYESDLEDDVPLINCKIDVEDDEMSKNKRSTETPMPNFVGNSKQDTRKTIKKDAIPTEQTTKEKSDPKVIRTAGKWTFKPCTYFKEPYTHHRPSSNKVKKQYKCNVCPRIFIDKNKLTVHIRVHTEEKPYECNICKRSFSQKSNLIVHIRTHTGEKPYECNFCQRNFSQKSRLMGHIRTHTSEKPHKCHVCHCNFNEKSNLTKHMRVHTGEKPYKCNFCQRCFSCKSDLTVHMRTHTGEKPYECNFCQRNFSQTSNLIVHMRTHTGEKPYECNFCQRNFCQKNSLRAHIRTHTSEKPHKCHVCHRNFNVKSNLTKHMRVHTGEKSYKCKFCQGCFSCKSDLRVHMRTHTGEKPYECNFCQRNFSQKSNLKVHMRTHNVIKPYECDFCRRTFSQKSNLIVHMRTHNDEKP